MDTLGDISPNEAAAAPSAAALDAPAGGTKRVSLRVRGATASLPVVSELTEAEPVTEAEIALVLAVLGDRIVGIIKP